MSYQLQGTMTAIPSYENRVSNEQGSTRFGLPKTLIHTPAPLYNETLSQGYLAAMVNILSEMGCKNISSGSYPQRGDHAMGTCRMANDASQGVVDENGKVFDVDNLYVLGHATFPSMGPVNPSLTMVAATLKALNNILLTHQSSSKIN
ncbi:MAG: GMC family oxidoreductase [Thalassotalea sp.]